MPPTHISRRRGVLLVTNLIGRRSSRFRERADIRLLRDSDRFDAQMYLERHPDVAASGVDAHVHFARHGARAGRAVGPSFDAAAYLERYPDVAASGLHPLIHYLRHGQAEGRVAQAIAAGPTEERPPEPSRPTGREPAPQEPLTPRRPRLKQRPWLRLAAPVGTIDDGVLTITCELDDAPSLHIAISGPEDALERVVPRPEPFVPVALLMAGATDRDLVVEEPLDADFVVALKVSYLRLLRTMFDFTNTDLEATLLPPGQRREPPAPDDGSALLFSGGVDSSYSLLRLREAGYPLRYLLNVNAGANGAGQRIRRLRQERLASFAASVGYDLLLVDTNFHQVVEIGHSYAHPFRTIPAAYGVYGAAGGLFISTAIHYEFLHFDWRERSPENAGTAITQSVAWRRMPVTEIGYDRTRFDKTWAISDDPITYDVLDVCVDSEYVERTGPGDAINCGRCWKCAGTTLTLEHIGRLERYASQFDLGLLARNREERLAVTAMRAAAGGNALLARLGMSPEEPIGDPPVALLDGSWIDAIEHLPVARPDWA